MDFRLVRGDKSDRAQFCSKISWDFDTERGRLAFVARLIGLANETECRIIGAVDDKSRRSLFCASRSDLRNLSSQTLQHYLEKTGRSRICLSVDGKHLKVDCGFRLDDSKSSDALLLRCSDAEVSQDRASGVDHPSTFTFVFRQNQHFLTFVFRRAPLISSQCFDILPPENKRNLHVHPKKHRFSPA